MKKYCKWKNVEIKKLFDFVEEYVKSSKSLSRAFNDYAMQNKRKPNSVRNYYYLELNNLLENNKRAKDLGIDLSFHKKKETKFFTQEEIENQMQQIVSLKNKGYSTRKACLEIARGDIEQMVRLQNKYRAILKKQPEYFEKFGEKKSNIISMPERKNKLTDNEINSLFVGLVKLVKSQAKQEANIYLKKEKEEANNQLRQALIELSTKEKQLSQLRKQFELLNNQSKTLNTKIENLRIENAKLNISSKNTKLKKWAEKNSKSKKTAN